MAVLMATVLACGLLGCASQGPRAAGKSDAPDSNSDARRAVLTTVQALFDAIETKDDAAVGALLEDGATVTAIRETDQGRTRSTTTKEQFAAGIARSSAALRETMTSPRVFIDGPLAVVWTPYDFFIDGERSHGGIDAIILIRDSAGAWRMHSIAYTAKPPPQS